MFKIRNLLKFSPSAFNRECFVTVHNSKQGMELIQPLYYQTNAPIHKPYIPLKLQNI